jgi:hypothetical protein
LVSKANPVAHDRVGVAILKVLLEKRLTLEHLLAIGALPVGVSHLLLVLCENPAQTRQRDLDTGTFGTPPWCLSPRFYAWIMGNG